MELIHKFFNIVAPPFTFFSICLFYPPSVLFNFLHSVLATLFPESLAGKVVIITGASSGIGEHLAYEYAKGGACLALVARREDSIREVADRAMTIGSPDCIVIYADVSKVDDCRRIVDETLTHFGRLDHLVNNGGMSSVSLLEDVHNITDFRPVMDSNFWGSIYTTHYAIPHLRSRKGKIVVLSSINSWVPVPRHSIYNASKAAVVSLYETLRVELKPDIEITIVIPGFIESELSQGKFLLKEGKVEADQDNIRDVAPVASVQGCVKRIVKGVRRGEKYVTVPAWFGVTYLWKALCPEVVEWSYRILMYMSNKILDLCGAINSPEVKTE